MMLKLNNVLEPHSGDKILYTGVDLENAKTALILIHGRGSTAESILPLANELNLDDTIVIAPQADQFTWYPYRFIEKRERNEPGISSGLALIDSIIYSLNDSGISTDNIFLLGFSQGACLILDYAARNPKKYAGIFALSGGLIGEKLNWNDYSGNLEKTPVFLGCSDNDFHIPEERVHESGKIFNELSSDVTIKIYNNMGHTISYAEIEEMNTIISKHINESIKNEQM
ncbi:MAG: dienelactone hydrolase family protein [Melioribacteraceae bacterium]|nr:dienelactone hydrolase family protein [Melioribacteraceae bacterium]